MDKQLIISVTQDGQMKISGSTFTVGELEAIGNQLIRVVQSQAVSFGEQDGEHKNQKPTPGPMSTLPPPDAKEN